MGFPVRKRLSDAHLEFVRYGLSAILALGVDYSILVVLTEFTAVHYLAAAAVAFAAGTVVSYGLSVSWGFEHRAFQDPRMEFFVYAAIGLAGLLLTQGILFSATDVLGFDYRISKLLAVAIVFFWNFGARKVALFTIRVETA